MTRLRPRAAHGARRQAQLCADAAAAAVAALEQRQEEQEQQGEEEEEEEKEEVKTDDSSFNLGSNLSSVQVSNSFHGDESLESELAELAEAAEAVSVEEWLFNLGIPRTLATQYAEQVRASMPMPMPMPALPSCVCARF